ncbi:MAG TPA: XTP/dITP diphosphatase [Nitrososphaerales archaeon]|nr:XTP/dITP diphosphatase [Nitrososphaerales archaeon]
MPGSSKKVVPTVLLATSNQGKLKEARAILASFEIRVEQFNGKGIEVQADTNSEVAAHASRGAAKAAGRPVLVEDAGLFVESLKGFPGPYSAYVFKTIGSAGIITLLARVTSRRASFVSSLAYCEPDGDPVLFEGEAKGTIARRPRGTKGFGFDPIFVPDRGTKTFGELSLREKCAVSHRARALAKFAKWYLSGDTR